MSRKTLNRLPSETVKLLASSQVITSVSTAVKELVENSIDADSKSVHVKLDNYGLDAIEVKDDGHGVSCENVRKMFLPGYTSKISSFDDLARLESYGFRGEALSALAKLSTVSVTTKTSADGLAMTYAIDREGVPESSKPSHVARGTIVTATNLFANLPVRKQYLSSKKRVCNELKRVEQVVQSLSLIHPELRMSLVHNKCPIWHKNSVKGLKQSFMQVVGLKITSRMEHLNELGNNVLADLIVPKKGLDNIDSLFTSSPHSVYVYVNRRPVTCSKISKIVMDHIFTHFASANPSGKYAVCLVAVEVPTREVDANLEPNKTKVYLKNECQVAKILDDILSRYYGQRLEAPEAEEEEEEEEGGSARKRPRIDDDAEEEEEVEEAVEANTRTKDEEFLQQSDDWLLEVISGVEHPPAAKSLCSQINSENCTLATQTEVGELARMLEESGRRLVTSVSAERSKEQEEEEKRILPSWPIRDVQPAEVKAEKVELAAWSRGDVHGDNGRLPGGVTLAKPTAAAAAAASTPDLDFDRSVQSVSSQMGRKEMSSFTKFAKIMRPKILQEFPGIVFTRVAGLLADRWKALPPDEKRQYEKLAKDANSERKLQAESETKAAKKASERREIPLTTSYADILRRRRGLRAAASSDAVVDVVGQLQPSGNWLYRKGKEIGHVRHCGLHELVLSRRMMSAHVVPRSPTRSAIPVTEETLGRDLWNLLLTLETEFDPLTRRDVVVSDVVSKNGFRLELEPSCDGGVASAWLTELASVIPFYGAAQLKDALSLRLALGDAADLSALRTTPVVNYITNEAVRIARQTDAAPARDELRKWIAACASDSATLQCPHFRDIFVPIYSGVEEES